MATQTLIDFINKNRPECKWIICFQHDNYPISKNFSITYLITSKKNPLINLELLVLTILIMVHTRFCLIINIFWV